MEENVNEVEETTGETVEGEETEETPAEEVAE